MNALKLKDLTTDNSVSSPKIHLVQKGGVLTLS